MNLQPLDDFTQKHFQTKRLIHCTMFTCVLFYSFPESEGDIPQHVMVLCSGHVFILTVTDDNKELLTPPELQKQLQYIKDTCDQQPKGPSVGILCAHNRSTWAEVSKLVFFFLY